MTEGHGRANQKKERHAMFRTLTVLVLTVLLAACASPTAYQPLMEHGSGGYSETRIEADRYRVEFTGNSLTARETVEYGLLIRAAELTLQAGGDYFLIVERDTDAKSRLVSTGFDRGPFYAHFSPVYYAWSPRHGWVGYRDPFVGFGSAWGRTEYREVTRFKASAEIFIRKGARPDDPNALDARQVLINLQPLMPLPRQ
jgi:hypothetical protein